MRLPFVMRWRLEVSEQRRQSVIDGAEKQAEHFREKIAEQSARHETAIAELAELMARDRAEANARVASLEALQAQHDARIADLRERLAEWRATATENRRLYETMVDGCLARDAKHVEDLAAIQAQHHELAMHPPTGILTGPQALSPLASFGPKTQEAIKAMSAGLGKANRDAMIAKAFEQKAQNVEDEAIANAIYRGESVKPPQHMRS